MVDQSKFPWYFLFYEGGGGECYEVKKVPV